MRKIFFISCLLLLSEHAFAQSLSTEKCEAFSMAERLSCLKEINLESLLQIKKRQNQVSKEIDVWFEESRYKARARSQFKKSQRSFINYRQQYCEFNVTLGGGSIGSGLEALREMCWIDINRQHLQQLNKNLQMMRETRKVMEKNSQ